MFDSSDDRASPMFGRYCLLDTPDARARLAATTTIASAFANEVSQPLTAAASYMHSCAIRLRGLGEGHEDLLAMIEQASNQTLKAGEMIRRLRNFVVTGKITGRAENLRIMVEKALASLAAAGASDVEIERTIPLTDFVLCERIQIEQILSALLRNACEAMAGCEERRITIGSTRQGEEIVVRVEDSGSGLPPGLPENLFEPHFSTRGGGRGLGLAICKAIVDGHGGRIWAEAAAHGGAAISFALPAADPAGEEATSRRG